MAHVRARSSLLTTSIRKCSYSHCCQEELCPKFDVTPHNLKHPTRLENAILGQFLSCRVDGIRQIHNFRLQEQW